MNKLLKRVFSIVVAALLLWMNIPIYNVSAISDYQDFDPDHLTIKVGYEGGPYLNIHTFSRAELEMYDMGRVIGYTHVKDNNKIAYDFGKGARLVDLLRIAGVDDSSIKRFIIVTEDKYMVNNNDINRDMLLRDQRYHFPNLIEYMDDPVHEKSGAESVDAFIAHSSLQGMLDVDRTVNRDELKRKYEEAATGNTIVPHNGFRLMVGAYMDLSKNTARMSATNVNQITVVLAGKPAVNVKPVEVIRETKVGNETVTEVINVDENYQPQVGDIIKTEVNEDTVDSDTENHKDNNNTEMELISARYYATKVFKEGLRKHYREEDLKIKVSVNPEVGEVLEDGSIKITGEGDLDLKGAYIDLGGKDIFEGRDGYMGSIKTFFRDTDGKDESGRTKEIVFNTTVKPKEPEEPEKPLEPEKPQIPEEPEKPSEPLDPGGNDPGTPDNPGNQNPGGNNPGTPDNPGNQNPGGNNPGTPDNPSNQNPGGNNPGTPDNPGNLNPGGNNPGTPDNPGNQNPGGNNPGTPNNLGSQNPGGNNPGDNNPGTVVISPEEKEKFAGEIDDLTKPGKTNNPGNSQNSSNESESSGGGKTWLDISSEPISRGQSGIQVASTNQVRNTTTGNTTRTLAGSQSTESARNNNSNRSSSTNNRNSSDTKRTRTTASNNRITPPTTGTGNTPGKRIDGDGDSIFQNIKDIKPLEEKKPDRAVSRKIYEMDDDSVILGELIEKNPLEPWALGIGIISFVYGLIYARLRFLKSL